MRPLQSLLWALLVENKLLVSQRRAGGLWTQKCVRCGAPMRVVGRFHPTASDEPAGEMESVLRAVEKEFFTTGGCFWKFVRGIFSVFNYKKGTCTLTEVNSLLLLFWDGLCLSSRALPLVFEVPIDDSLPFTHPILRFNFNQLRQSLILHWWRCKNKIE